VSLEQEIISRVTYLTVKVVPVIIIAVFLSNLLREYGVIKKLDFLVRPLIRGANLPDGSGAFLVTSLASGTASYSMLGDHHKNGELDDTQVIVISIMNTFFHHIHHFFTYWVPVAIPLLGLRTGLMYVALRMTIGLAMTLSAVVIGRIFIKKKSELLSEGKDHSLESNATKINHSLKGTKKTLKSILPRLYIVYIAAVAFLAAGYLESIGNVAEPLAHIFGLPGEAITIIAIQLVDVTSGYVIAGALLQNGTLNSFQAVIALLLGTMITLSMTYAKHSLPTKIVFFGARLGTKVAVYNLILNLSLSLIALLVLLFLF
jgi:hypothetical protein